MYVDKRNNIINVGDYVMIGLKTSGMGQCGEIHIGRVTDMNGVGVQLEGTSGRVKVPHRMTKVTQEFHDQWKFYQ